MKDRDPADVFSRLDARPVGIGFTILIWILVLWAGIYVAANSGGFRADVYKPTAIFTDDRAAQASLSPQALGRLLYTQNCAICHLPDGTGVAKQFPPLAGSEWVTDGGWHGDNHLVRILLCGIQGPAYVEGQVYNNIMPPWSQFDDRQIAAILTYVRDSWGNNAPAVSPEYVGEIRKTIKVHNESWSEAELQAIPRATAAPPVAKPSVSPAPEKKLN